MKYVAAGNVMVDEVYLSENTRSDIHVGGPAFFALAGMKLWEDDVMLRSNVGSDFEKYYGKWFDDNGVTRHGIEARAQWCTHNTIRYHADGSYEGECFTGLENMGFLRCRPEDLRRYCEGAVGVYLAQDADPIVWDAILKVRDELGFKIMWEIEARWAIPEKLDDIISIAKKVDMYSMNLNEASIMFGMGKEYEKEILEKLAAWGVPFIFLRAGAKGSYSIADGVITFHPSIGSEAAVDATGCGNCSTGAAAYAFASGRSAVEAAIMGNISAYYNVLQYGTYEKVTPEMRAEACKLLEEALQNIR